jgi:hypothetical protein
MILIILLLHNPGGTQKKSEKNDFHWICVFVCAEKGSFSHPPTANHRFESQSRHNTISEYFRYFSFFLCAKNSVSTGKIYTLGQMFHFKAKKQNSSRNFYWKHQTWPNRHDMREYIEWLFVFLSSTFLSLSRMTQIKSRKNVTEFQLFFW